jgi:2-iminobutanoate/2-iminopropanoate deaminase
MRTLACLLLLTMTSAGMAAEKKVIRPKELADRPPNPNFSLGLLVDGTLYVSGQTGTDLKTGKKPDEFGAELKTCLDNIGLVLKEAGMDFGDVVSVQVYLTDMDTFAAMNDIYKTYFKEPRPTRTTVGVAKLSGNARVEITVTARK